MAEHELNANPGPPVLRGAAAWALLGSFAIYCAPLVGPHAVWLLGEHLWHELFGRGAGLSLGWVATDFAAALTAQAILAILLYRVLTRPRIGTLLLLLVAAPVGFVAIEWTFMLAIPTMFLIEADASPERRVWTSACFLPDLALAAVRTAPDLPLERAGRAWVTGTDGKSEAIIEGCDRRVPLALGDAGPPSTVPFVLPSGGALFGTWSVRDARTTWWSSPDPGSPARPLDRPPSDPDRVAPVLSEDGRWMAWIEHVPGATVAPIPERVLLREIDGERERAVPLDSARRASVVLLAVDVGAKTLTLFEHEYATRQSSLVTLGFDGRPRGAPLRAPGVEPQSGTFLRVGDGWVAWDAYREEGRYRVAWSLAEGHGEHEVPKGRGITAVGADPGGRYVAISTTTALNIGRIRDSVYVLRARDGSEAYRVYLPAYARSRVAFLGDSRFVHNDQQGTRFGVRILEVPER